MVCSTSKAILSHGIPWMLVGVYAIPRTINVDSCKEADGKSVKTSTERKLLACRAKGEPLSIALLLNSPTKFVREQIFAAINKAIMNKWLLQAPQARCGMSHVAPWSLLVLLRSWKPWLKSTKYQIPSGQEVYKPESWFRHFYCGQVYLQ